MLRKFIVFTLLLLSLGSVLSEPQQRSSSDTQGRFFDLGTLLGINRYPYRPPYYGSGAGYPGGNYPGGYGGGYPGGFGIGGGSGYYPGGGYGTNFIGNGGGYGGFGGNNGLDSYYGYNNNNNKNYVGGGNVGFGYYSPDAFENRNTQPQSVPSGYRGYN